MNVEPACRCPGCGVCAAHDEAPALRKENRILKEQLRTTKQALRRLQRASAKEGPNQMKPIDKAQRPYAAATHTAQPGDRVEFLIKGHRLEIFYDDVRGGIRIHKTGDRMEPIAVEPSISNEVIVR